MEMEDFFYQLGLLTCKVLLSKYDEFNCDGDKRRGDKQSLCWTDIINISGGVTEGVV